LNDVPVPCANLIGKENEGFKVIMKNFNHERWGFVIQANRFARCCLRSPSSTPRSAPPSARS
jgi:alkylation response protein AidB-like acyl-CoA dehydrogenase